jgi:hypothetical protein
MEREEQARKKMLDKLRKLFALSKSSEPHEAAAAIRQAQKMMEQHSITEDEIEGLVINTELVITPEPYKVHTQPLYLSCIAALCCRAFGCSATFEFAGGNQGVRYFGMGASSAFAKYAHEVMFREMRKAWNQYRASDILGFNASDRASFWIGWLAGVEDKVVAFGLTDEQKQKVQAARDRFYGKDEIPNAKISEPKLDSRSTQAGKRAAASFSIHRPVGEDASSNSGSATPSLLGWDGK